MNVVARNARPEDLARLLPQIDEAFVFGKGRRISMAQRFPAVYCAENLSNVFVLEENGEILSSLFCKNFTLLCGGASWRGAMIGGVHTHPQRRGAGLASRLLEQVSQMLRQRGLDFAVLWAAEPQFYARLGWHAADRGMLGNFKNSVHVQISSDVIALPASALAAARIEKIRARWCTCLTPRKADDYRHLPPPAETVQLYMLNEGSEQAAYALVGYFEDTATLYEMIGDTAAFPALWSAVCHRSHHIVVNDLAGSPSHQWLAENAGLVWQQKPLAMWQFLSKRIDMANVTHWYIPYYDRI